MSQLEGIVQLDARQSQALLERVRERIDPEDFNIIQGLLFTVSQLLDMITASRMSIAKLKQMIFGAKTEKFPKSDPAKKDKEKPRPKPKGHGRIPAREYTGARKVSIALEDLQPGQCCPDCQHAKLYTQKPGAFVFVKAQALFEATLYEPERLRCQGCGKTYTAPLPEEIAHGKYHSNVPAMIAMLRYGMGMPHYRLDKTQKTMGVPMPAATQNELINTLAQSCQPVMDALKHEAAQASLFFNDDTTIKITRVAPPEEEEHKGTWTTGILCQDEQRTIALFSSGRQHAGNNLGALLDRRDNTLDKPIQMCDGLSRNWPSDHKTKRSQCVTHGRRNFVDIRDNFEGPCDYFIERLGNVYHIDQLARDQKLDAPSRLQFHQEHSTKVMEELKDWLEEQKASRDKEPNSSFGQACDYMLKRWEEMTLFLREPGAPLDNTPCERLLKTAILHRKNSLFYRTLNGAKTGDLYMSLIQTCALNQINPLDYLNALSANVDKLADNPSAWLPWNYTNNLAPPGTAGKQG